MKEIAMGTSVRGAIGVAWLLAVLSASTVARAAQLAADQARMPVRFETNRGQFGPSVRFLVRGTNYGVYLGRAGATLAFSRRGQRAVVSMGLAGGRRDIDPIGVEQLPGRANYFVGSDPSRWRTNVEGYARVKYPGVLPGVDVVYYGTGSQRLEYDLVIAPGADLRRATITFTGLRDIEIDSAGAAHLEVLGGGELLEPAPVAYQIDERGERRFVPVRYERRDSGLGFHIGTFDASRELVIDPTLVYSTYLGGTGSDQPSAVAVDAAGEVFLTGSTTSSDFPGGGTAHGAGDAFVTKLDASGTSLVYSTYFGGSASDTANGIAVDGAGAAYIVGRTLSLDVPWTILNPNVYQVNAGDAFLTKLNADGTIAFADRLGGSGDETGYGVAVDGAGEAFVTGQTPSADFPVVNAVQSARAGSNNLDAFISKVRADGSGLVYSTYLGGTNLDSGRAIALDALGEAVVTGMTLSTNFPTASALRATAPGGGDTFVAKLSAAGSALVYSTYLGGSGPDTLIPNSVAVLSTGEAFVLGATQSTDFPTQSAFQPTLASPGQFDTFVTELSAAGALVYSTYFGGSQADTPSGIAVDPAGAAYVTGSTQSANFPIDGLLGTAPPSSGTFITKFVPAGNTFAYSNLFSSGGNASVGIAVDPAGEAFLVGTVSGTDFQTVSPVQSALASAPDGFVTKISGPINAPDASHPPATTSGGTLSSFTVPIKALLPGGGYELSSMSFTATATSLDPIVVTWSSDTPWFVPADVDSPDYCWGGTTVSISGAGTAVYEIDCLMNAQTSASFLSPTLAGTSPVFWDVSGHVFVPAGMRSLGMAAKLTFTPSAIGETVTVSSEYRAAPAGPPSASVPVPALPWRVMAGFATLMALGGAWLARSARRARDVSAL